MKILILLAGFIPIVFFLFRWNYFASYPKKYVGSKIDKNEFFIKFTFGISFTIIGIFLMVKCLIIEYYGMYMLIPVICLLGTGIHLLIQNIKVFLILKNK